MDTGVPLVEMKVADIVSNNEPCPFCELCRKD